MSEVVEELSVDELMELVRTAENCSSVQYEVVRDIKRTINFKCHGADCEIFCPKFVSTSDPAKRQKDLVAKFNYISIDTVLSSKNLVGDVVVNALNANLMNGTCFEREGFVSFKGFIYFDGGVTKTYIKNRITFWGLELKDCLEFIKQAEKDAVRVINQIDGIFKSKGSKDNNK